MCGLGNRKNELFGQILDRGRLDPYPGTVAVLNLLDEHGMAQAIVSSSRNARRVLDAAGMGERFSVIVDGTTAAAEGIAGKPAPDMFLRAAELLGVAPRPLCGGRGMRSPGLRPGPQAASPSSSASTVAATVPP